MIELINLFNSIKPNQLNHPNKLIKYYEIDSSKYDVALGVVGSYLHKLLQKMLLWLDTSETHSQGYRAIIGFRFFARNLFFKELKRAQPFTNYDFRFNFQLKRFVNQ